MTTQTKAKRTEGVATIHPDRPTAINLGAAHRIAQVATGLQVDDEDIANAEYIRKAWNMHEELAAFAQDAAKWFVKRPGGMGNLEARAATLLSRCQQE